MTGSEVAGKAEHRLVARLRPRQREQRPARLRRPHAAPAGPGKWPGALHPHVVQRLSADAVSTACARAAPAIPCSISQNPAGVDSDDRRTMLDALSELNHDAVRALRRPGNPDPHLAIRDGLPHAALRPGTHRSLRANRQPPSTCTAPIVKRPAPSPPAASSPAASSSAACASCRSFTAAGTSTATCPARSRNSMQRHRPGHRRAHQGPQAARSARRHARRLGRRIRPQRLQPGHAHQDNYGRDHHPRNFCMWMAGGGVKGGMSYGETDDFCYNVVRIPCPSTTSTPRSCTAWASTTSASPTSSRASTSASRTCTERSCRSSWRDSETTGPLVGSI